MRLQHLLLLFLQVCPYLLPMQTVTASITGTVTDTSGASIPSAKVVATNAGTALTLIR